MKQIEPHWLRAIRFFANECLETVPCSVATPRGEEQCVIEGVVNRDHVRLVRLRDGKPSTRPVHFCRVLVEDDVARELEAITRVASELDGWRADIHFEPSS